MAAMNCLSLRAALPWMATALFLTACGGGRDATGECRGTYLGEAVVWPIDGVASRLMDEAYDSNWVNLTYLPRGQAGLTGFGVDILLDKDRRIDEGSGSRTVLLINKETEFAPEVNLLVHGWYGTLRKSSGSGRGYHEASGLPRGGSVTFDVVDDKRAAGHFIYRYENGDELTCTFDAPTPAEAEGIFGGAGDGDDDDD